MEERATVELTYAELWAILESGTISETSALYKKLSALRVAFERKPKVYGNGLGLKVRHEALDAINAKTQEVS